jgi:phosphoribosylformylglycinamidine synthase
MTSEHDWGADLLALLDDPTIASKRWVYRQYDQQVLANTVVMAGAADAAVVRLRPQQGEGALKTTERAVAATVDCPNRWVALDPERGAMAAVAEAARNLSCVGAEPLAVTDNLNFPSPDTDRGYWQLAMACRGLSEACRQLNTPVTGGNVSLYNETRRDDGVKIPIHPTPVVGMVGLVDAISRVVGLGWQQAGDAVVVLGVPMDEQGDDRLGLAGSAYQGVIHGQLTGRPPRPDLNLEVRVQALVRAAIAAELLASAHDCSDGGLAVALAECCLAAGLGAAIDLGAGLCQPPGARPERLLFAEGGARIIVSVKSSAQSSWDRLLAGELGRDLVVTPLGTVSDQGRLSICSGAQQLLDLELTAMRTAYDQALPRRMEAA